ncbi:MAG: DUF512 domain-containing protein [Clostridia bacterium]|nr:DUF512 domain-containing protein [Clostridia bacterium]
MSYPVVTEVSEESLADKAGIKCGDLIKSINNEKIRDILDFRFFGADPFLMLEAERDGASLNFEIENETGEDIGLTLCFGDADKTRRCKNKCIFCFIDQMPKGMRESLYVKDDDVRLSFLTGSYITLTNLSDEDIERIIRQHISPVNVSVHTVNPSLRVEMLKNKDAGKVYKLMKKLAKHKIVMNCQVVLVKGVNDGKELSKTTGKLLKLYPYVASLSIVPVGLTRYRDKLPKLSPFGKEDSLEVIKQIEGFQKKAHKKYGVNFVYASDEFYLKAEMPLPSEESYDGYPQIENGVGMITSFREEADLAIFGLPENIPEREVGIITGVAAYDLMCETAKKVKEKCSSVNTKVFAIRNEFFGESVTVSGLVTGGDIINQLKGKHLPSEILMPEVMFRDSTDIMLDDVTIETLEKELNVKITKIKTDGYSTVDAICGLAE